MPQRRPFELLTAQDRFASRCWQNRLAVRASAGGRLQSLYPQHHFIWLLGSDTLPNFHKWRDWRGLARIVPIAVLPRAGYDRTAHAARAMGWLRRFVHPSSQAISWTEWSAPAIFFLRLPQDPTSATAIRANNPHWHRRPSAIESHSRHLAKPISVRNRLESTSR